MAVAQSAVEFITAAGPSDRHVVYETNFKVEPAVAPAFMEYLKAHMKEILDLQEGKLFDKITMCTIDEEDAAEPDKKHLCAQYRARSRWKLQEYFDKYGERLRKDMREKFPGQFTVSRRILAVQFMLE